MAKLPINDKECKRKRGHGDHTRTLANNVVQNYNYVNNEWKSHVIVLFYRGHYIHSVSKKH